MRNEEVDDMTLLDKMYVDFCKEAKTIPGFKIGQKEDVEYDITDLANKYVKAMETNDKEGMNKYCSALMVRYWHMVPYLYNQSKSSKLEIEDMVSWIWQGFTKAFKYKSWLDPNKAISKDPKGAEKCFNQCITSVRQYWYKHFNTNSAKVNYLATSLDSLYETMGDAIEEQRINKEEDSFDNEPCKLIIKKLVDSNSIFDAIVVDKICFDDCTKTKKTKKEIKQYDEDGNEEVEEIDIYSNEFDFKKLTSIIKSIDDDYLTNFSREYGVPTSKVKEELMAKTKRNLKENIANSFMEIKNNAEVLQLLC